MNGPSSRGVELPDNSALREGRGGGLMAGCFWPEGSAGCPWAGEPGMWAGLGEGECYWVEDSDTGEHAADECSLSGSEAAS